MLHTRSEYPLFDLDGGLVGHPVRPRGPIPQAGGTLGIEPGNPTMRTLTRHPHCLGHMGYRHSLLSDPMNQQRTTMNRQTGITVGQKTSGW